MPPPSPSQPYGFPKPIRGTSTMRIRGLRKKRKAHERDEMRAAKVRDGFRCRWPKCAFKDLPLDAAHVVQHRGIGGNPDGTRTSREATACLCRNHHGLLDADLIRFVPKTKAGTDGPCQCSILNPDTRRWEDVGISMPKGIQR